MTDQVTDRKTGRPGDRRTPAYEVIQQQGRTTLHVRSYDIARAILKAPEGTRQGGFNADLIESSSLRRPMLFAEGAEHREQRRLAAKFFTPKAVATKHQAMIEALADQSVAELARNGGGRLDLVSFRLAMLVVVEVLGLTESDTRAMERLLERFFRVAPGPDAPRLVRWRALAENNLDTLRFYLAHVRPAVRARRAAPQDDVVSALLEQGLRDRDLLIECLTYAAAGMVTTRQFISVAAWHLIDRPELRRRFVDGSDTERRAILGEIVRLDTVAGNLRRRTTRPFTVETDDGPVELPEGALVDIQVRAANIDPDAFGTDAPLLDADRCPRSRVPLTGLAFGDGHHSCPGEYLAMQETDIFLRRFFQHEWRMEGTPAIAWNEVVLAYDITGLVVRPLG